MLLTMIAIIALVSFVIAVVSLESFTLVINGEVKETTASWGKERIGHFAILPPNWWQIRLILLESLLPVFLMLGIDVLNPFGVPLLTTIVASEDPPRVTKDVDLAEFVKSFDQGLDIVGSDTE